MRWVSHSKKSRKWLQPTQSTTHFQNAASGRLCLCVNIAYRRNRYRFNPKSANNNKSTLHFTLQYAKQIKSDTYLYSQCGIILTSTSTLSNDRGYEMQYELISIKDRYRYENHGKVGWLCLPVFVCHNCPIKDKYIFWKSRRPCSYIFNFF